jgi:flagellar motor switch/type III secretory pathway protein FliN
MASEALKPEPQPAASPHQVSAAGESDLLDTMPWLPCKLTLDIPVAGFTISDLFNLTKGTIVETAYHHNSDIPLRVNQLLLGWTEFDVIGDRLAVRITDLA